MKNNIKKISEHYHYYLGKKKRLGTRKIWVATNDEGDRIILKSKTKRDLLSMIATIERVENEQNARCK
jgi:hypothetical protein